MAFIEKLPEISLFLYIIDTFGNATEDEGRYFVAVYDSFTKLLSTWVGESSFLFVSNTSLQEVYKSYLFPVSISKISRTGPLLSVKVNFLLRATVTERLLSCEIGLTRLLSLCSHTDTLKDLQKRI